MIFFLCFFQPPSGKSKHFHPKDEGLEFSDDFPKFKNRHGFWGEPFRRYFVLDLFFRWFFICFYRSKSPLNHPLGAYVWNFFPSKKKQSVENPYKLFRFQVSIKFWPTSQGLKNFPNRRFSSSFGSVVLCYDSKTFWSRVVSFSIS